MNNLEKKNKFILKAQKVHGNKIDFSKVEDEIFTYLQSIGIRDIIRNERTIIKPYEIDLYSPSYKIGIEFDGLKWHSDEFKNNSNYQFIQN